MKVINKRKISGIVLLIITFISCNNIENKVQGHWTIEKMTKGKIDLLQVLYSNGFGLKEDHSCTLPIDNLKDRHSRKETGEWKVFEKSGKEYLQIISENKNFHGTYHITNSKTITDSISLGQLVKISFVSDSITIHCIKTKI